MSGDDEEGQRAELAAALSAKALARASSRGTTGSRGTAITKERAEELGFKKLVLVEGDEGKVVAYQKYHLPSGVICKNHRKISDVSNIVALFKKAILVRNKMQLIFKNRKQISQAKHSAQKRKRGPRDATTLKRAAQLEADLANEEARVAPFVAARAAANVLKATVLPLLKKDAINALLDGTFQVQNKFKRVTTAGSPALVTQQHDWIAKRFEFQIVKGMNKDLWQSVQEEHEDINGMDVDEDDGL